jgi:hypothetical protein
VAKRVALVLAALVLGYFLGFADGRRHESNVIVRAVQRVQGVGEHTVGARERKIREELNGLRP